ncbi:glucose-6-phosphate isomerase [Ramlibacter henchirensis]|uniref:Glucose-6-phosphate isomerase n=1 Tax=Ramlibacter henchirensis TaxID=204072 RepID=A0A4Z0C4F7_9BURK|nr:glucose-6-phosphate isomerase [Ramlibacter henchirensis]TFZ06557.1 glucose-6-phosphate isomerase [Ramlibacter henchirensis]
MAASDFPRCDETGAWKALRQHFDGAGRGFDVRRALRSDAARVQACSVQAPHVFADLSKNLVDPHADRLLLQLAQECGVLAQRDAMFAGETINNTESRQVMHFLLRAPKQGRAGAKLSAELAQVHETLDRMLAFAEEVRADSRITDVVNIGIGGSDLGPQMATIALEAFVTPGKRFHFVSNIDAHELAAVLKQVKPEGTLFLIASKTFSTLETMTNARSAREWFTRQGGTDVARHFAALTTNVKAAAEFGIARTFGFWDWVGGRYSMWSAIGLPIAIAVGAGRFRELLAGAHEMDRHFREAPPERNLPLRLALLDVWYRDFHGFNSRSVAPYHSSLRRLPAYLQQLEMESNGKRVDRQGRPLPFATSPVVWGEPGTNGQHAYFQMLHQGTDVVPVEFVAVKTPAHDLAEHHPQLLANVLAQAAALMQGKEDSGGHKHFPGNRPSTMLLLERLDPQSLGALIALYEHRVFCAGALWGINSFDQWGVELGKVLAKDIAPRLQSGDTQGLDASTAALIERLRG